MQIEQNKLKINPKLMKIQKMLYLDKNKKNLKCLNYKFKN